QAKKGEAAPNTPVNRDEVGAPEPYPTMPAAPAAPADPGKVVTPGGPPAKSKMTFFVTSTGSGALGGNLGGLTGADKKCQDLATAAAAGDHTWHAYLSVAGTNAKDRIGSGPWLNQRGETIAGNVTQLHDFQFIPQNSIMIDEKGADVPATAT